MRECCWRLPCSHYSYWSTPIQCNSRACFFRRALVPEVHKQWWPVNSLKEHASAYQSCCWYSAYFTCKLSTVSNPYLALLFMFILCLKAVALVDWFCVQIISRGKSNLRYPECVVRNHIDYRSNQMYCLSLDVKELSTSLLPSQYLLTSIC